jgi:hypothetical protein
LELFAGATATGAGREAGLDEDFGSSSARAKCMPTTNPIINSFFTFLQL